MQTFAFFNTDYRYTAYIDGISSGVTAVLH